MWDGLPDFLAELRAFSLRGQATEEVERDGLRYFINEYWTSAQRQAHSLHEISYRACFKPQLPAFFIDRLTVPGETVYDPFSGRGTTALQAALMRRRPAANDVNPLSAMLVGPRLAPPSLGEIERRLGELDLVNARPLPPPPFLKERGSDESDLLAFFHPETLRQLHALRARLGDDRADAWLRMVALNRLTGHSPGFFSVYTLPPNQAASAAAQRRINARRSQTPPPRDVAAILRRKSAVLLADGAPPPHPRPLLTTGPAERNPAVSDGSVALIVTSPPFMDIVDYAGDNWLRGWLAGIDPASVPIARHREVRHWEAFVRACFTDFARVLRPGGVVAFEVGEVRRGLVLLERHVAAALAGLPFDLIGVMLNRQRFTKTANCWGVGNNAGGTNTNRIVLARRW